MQKVYLIEYYINDYDFQSKNGPVPMRLGICSTPERAVQVVQQWITSNVEPDENTPALPQTIEEAAGWNDASVQDLEDPSTEDGWFYAIDIAVITLDEPELFA